MTRKSVQRKKWKMSLAKQADGKEEVAQRLEICCWLMTVFSKQGKTPWWVNGVLALDPFKLLRNTILRGSSEAGIRTSPSHILLKQKEMLSREHIYYQFWENENTQETIISILQQKIGFSGE